MLMARVKDWTTDTTSCPLVTADIMDMLVSMGATTGESGVRIPKFGQTPHFLCSFLVEGVASAVRLLHLSIPHRACKMHCLSWL